MNKHTKMYCSTFWSVLVGKEEAGSRMSIWGASGWIMDNSLKRGHLLWGRRAFQAWGADLRRRTYAWQVWAGNLVQGKGLWRSWRALDIHWKILSRKGCFSLCSLCERTVSTRRQLGVCCSVPGAGCGGGVEKRLTGLEGTLRDWTWKS